MISLTIRSYEGETDLQAISDLLNACEAVDELNQEASVSELWQASDNPSLDKTRDVQSPHIQTRFGSGGDRT